MAKGKKRAQSPASVQEATDPGYEKPKPPKVRSSRNRTPRADASPVLPVWDRLSSRTRHLICLAFLFGVTVAFFAAIAIGGKTLVGGDTVQWRAMAQAMIEHEETSGSLPLWAPNLFGGMPGYMIYYPLAVPQLDTVVTALRSAGWWPTAHFFALLVGAYLLVFFLLRDHLASTLAAVAYGLTTYVPLILLAGHNTKFVAMAYAPWLVLAFVYAIRRPPGASWMRTLLGGLLFAAALAVNLRAGHIQLTYYIVFALGILWIVEGIYAAREGSLKGFAVSTGALALGGALGVLMVAHPYLVYAEYKAFTIRSSGPGGGLAFDYAMQWSQGIGELLTLIIPGAYGETGATYWGPKPFTAGPHYVGPVVLVLAALGLYGVRRRLVVGLGVAAAVMVLLSLGEHFAPLSRLMFEVFPLYSSFRVPETWLAAVALVLAVLAGVGVYYLVRAEATPEAEARKTRAVYVAAGAMGAFLLLMLVGHDAVFSFERDGEAAQVTMAAAQQSGRAPQDPELQQVVRSYLADLQAQRSDMFAGDAMRSLIFVLLAGALLVLVRLRKIPAWALQVGLLLLVTVDLWQVDRRFFNEQAPALRSVRDIAAQVPEYGFDQFIQARVEVAGGPGHFRALSLEGDPWTNARPAFHYESVGGYHAAKLALYQDYIEEIVTTPEGGLNPRGLDLMSTRYVVASQPVPGLDPVFQDPRTGLLVLENPDYLPRAYFVERAEVVEDRDQMIAMLREGAVDLREVALLAEPPPQPLAPAPIDSASAATVTLRRFNPDEIIYEVETDRPRLLVFSEVYYPAGWEARIGDDPTPILRANHLLRAVVVPEGRHLVSMRFEPETHALAARVAGFATAFVYLGALLLAGLLWYRRGHGG